jgi:ArsR family transcriptional regulator
MIVGSEGPSATVRAPRAVRLGSARRTAILKALADPRRFELLERIARAGCPLGCAEARAALPISAATLSHHIKELETAGLIDVRREGKFHFLTLKPGVLRRIIEILAALDTAPCPTVRAAQSQTEETRSVRARLHSVRKNSLPAGF